MEPRRSRPLNATEVGLLFIADHAICVALDEDPTQGSWWFRLHAKPPLDAVSFLTPIALLAVFLAVGVRDRMLNLVEQDLRLHALDHLLPGSLGRIATVFVFAILLFFIEVVRRQWDGTWNPLRWLLRYIHHR